MKKQYFLEWFSGILIDSGERIRFSQYIDLKLSVGDWANCLDKKDPEQKFCVEKIVDDIYYFKKVWYDKSNLL